MMIHRVVVALAVVLFVGGVTRAENLVSGPQVGEKVSGRFSVLFLNGDHAGAKLGSSRGVSRCALSRGRSKDARQEDFNSATSLSSRK